MVISNFEDLLRGAGQQPEPQRMLFVFAEKGLPDDHPLGDTNGDPIDSGGTLSPVVCVDKSVAEVSSFANLVKESEATGQHWDIVMVACLAGKNGAAPSVSDVDQGLNMMVDAVKTGDRLWRFLAFDRHGDPLQIVI